MCALRFFENGEQMFKKRIAVSIILGFSIIPCGISCCDGFGIAPQGFFFGDDSHKFHFYDESLAFALVDFFIKERAQSIVDFGCGNGDYVKVLLSNQIDAIGYDGNPDTPKMTDGVGHVLDLSKSFDLNRSFDWVLSFEVGEHLPKEYERIFIENLNNHNNKGIILSWAIEGQTGFGHFNERNNDYIKKIFTEYGYLNDLESENDFRMKAAIPWFKNTIMVFRKNSEG